MFIYETSSNFGLESKSLLFIGDGFRPKPHPEEDHGIWNMDSMCGWRFEIDWIGRVGNIEEWYKIVEEAYLNPQRVVESEEDE